MAPRLTRTIARGDTPRRFNAKKVGTWLCLAAAGLALGGCEEPRPLSFTEFMEDDFARDGTLARCNEDREASAGDIACANARRAAMAIALREERARREELEAESERLRAELRERIAQQQEAERLAREAEEAAERVAYEAQWVDPDDLELPPGVDIVIEQVEPAGGSTEEQVED
jgi:hypothetical protein